MNKVTVVLLLCLISALLFVSYAVGQRSAENNLNIISSNSKNVDIADADTSGADTPGIGNVTTTAPSASGNPFYSNMKGVYMDVADNGVRLNGDFYINGQPPTYSDVVNTINSPGLCDNRGNPIDMNKIIVLDDGTVVLRTSGDKIDARAYIAPTETPVPTPTLPPGSIPVIKDSPPDLTLARDLSRPDTFRGTVDFNFHNGLNDGSLGIFNTTNFVDSRIGMENIPRRSSDDRPGSLLACYVLEQDGCRVWLDFNNISIYMADGSTLTKEAYTAAISEIAQIDSQYNEIDIDQLKQFVTNDVLYQLHYRYMSYEEASKASFDQSGVPDPSFFGRKAYVDTGVVEVSMEPKDAAGYYHGTFYVYDGESGEMKTRFKAVHINQSNGLMDSPQ